MREVFNIALEKRNLNKREVKRLVGNLHNHPRHLKALVNYMKEKQIAVQFEDNTIKWDEFTEFYDRLFDELVGISARNELGTAAANVPCFPLDEVRLIDERIQVSHLSKQDRQTNDLTRLHQILGTIFQILTGLALSIAISAAVVWRVCGSQIRQSSGMALRR